MSPGNKHVPPWKGAMLVPTYVNLIRLKMASTSGVGAVWVCEDVGHDRHFCQDPHGRCVLLSCKDRH